LNYAGTVTWNHSKLDRLQEKIKLTQRKGWQIDNHKKGKLDKLRLR